METTVQNPTPGHDWLDVLIIGAGVAGISAACHLRRNCPGKRFAIIERRNTVGGTWDLFRYPGVRSDSDMFTYGYSFKPWNKARLLADGQSILGYLGEAAREHDVDRNILFGRKVVRARWSSSASGWEVETLEESTGRTEIHRARFLVCCTGYYNYDRGYRPDFPGEAEFKGRIVHPQHWPDDLDYANKRVIVIGSGATAVTLVPSMAPQAAHVTMLQRSPGYLISFPANDAVARLCQRLLPRNTAYRLTRARYVALQRLSYILAKRFPAAMRRLLLELARRQLDGKVDMRHFTPRYQPWDQRLCVVPGGDFFRVLREGRASIVTDEIESFVGEGIRLSSGEVVAADIVVTATGLEVQMLGGMRLEVDGTPVPLSQRMMYKAVQLEGVPNLAMLIGYTNTSWTLKVDLAAEYVCRLLRHMDQHGYSRATPRAAAGQRAADTILDGLSSGYVRRAASVLPRQGQADPWLVSHNYHRDLSLLLKAPIENDGLDFGRAEEAGDARIGHAPVAVEA